MPKQWIRWWSSLSPLAKALPLGIVVAYWFSLHLLGGLKSDHIAVGCGVLALAYLGSVGRAILNFLLPPLLTVTLYDSMRYYADYLRGPIHVTEPYNFDKTFFGIPTAQGVLTPNEWFQIHTHPALDVVTGFFYLTFVAIFLLIGAYLYFAYPKTRGTPESRRMMWAFFWVNMLGYSTYYWYAAAPPWYVAAYGLGPAQLNIPASAAGCLRFDHALGTHFFTEMYGRAADVFGAVPSLHVAYPLLAFIYSLRAGTLRTFSLFFYLIMCFSAVYLNHHYILDILWGSAYACLIVWILDHVRFKGDPIKT